jgi:hypothetical protein
MTIRHARSSRRLLAWTVIVVSLAAVMISATPAKAAQAAGAYDGRYPRDVPGCLSSNIRAGNGTPDPVASLWSNNYYYGWAEQRYGTRGSCRGYQWIRLHVTRTIWVAYTQNLGFSTFVNPGNSGVVAGTDRSTPVPPGDYDLQVLYVTWRHICAYSTNHVVEYLSAEPLFFGHNARPVNDEGWGPGWWCA